MAESRLHLAQVRPPAVPLITHDPYFSVWSFADRLTEGWTRHWTGAGNGMCGMARIDGKVYRFAGEHAAVPPMEQVSLRVLPTSTIYTFREAGVELCLTFMTPALCHDLDLLSRPITYLVFAVRSLDGKAHRVLMYYDVTAEWAVDSASDTVDCARLNIESLSVLRAGASQQKVLARSGDNLRSEWGYLYLAGDAGLSCQAIAEAHVARDCFIQSGTVPGSDAIIVQHPVSRGWPALSFAMDLGKVSGETVQRTLLIGYDDVFSVEYLHRKLRPYWRRNGADVKDALLAAAGGFDAIRDLCEMFDRKLTADLAKAGGEEYSAICALAYRQAIAAHKLVADLDGTPLFFSKENFSNGCIATVDVTYPSAPLFLLLNPALLEGMLTPILQYASTSRWKLPFAPHDLGQYPLANGQVYGGGETSERDQMPVEECGNMLILLGALAHVRGDAEYALKYWGLISRWAQYLKKKGLDPENQLCTDDFAGHLGHNTNLSLKAIIGLACYAKMAEMAGERKAAKEYRAVASRMAKQWQKMAWDGDHYRLAFDQPGTWSQKYNLVWDRILGLGLFPAEVAEAEVAHYRKVLARYGMPLDNRKGYTKNDWSIWSATLARDESDFRALLAPIYTWLNETPSRVPVTDWYETSDGRQVGSQARSVVGGFFIKLLTDDAIWRKWAAVAKRAST